MSVSMLREKAKRRPEGYFEDVMSRGVTKGDILTVGTVDYELLREKYSGVPASFNYPEPSLLDLARNFTLAVANFVKAGCPVVNELELVHRRETCYGCDKWKPQGLYARCALCGCSKFKLWLRTERCPLGKWKV